MELVKNRSSEYDGRYRTFIASGVALCIVGVIPHFFAGAYNLDTIASVACLCILLLFAACAVYMFILSGMINGSFQKLLQMGDYSAENKKIEKNLSFLPGAYWVLLQQYTL